MPPRRQRSTPLPVSDSTAVDPAQAKAAYDALSSELDALDASTLLAVRVDAQLAGAHAFSVASRDRKAERAARFEKLVRAELLPADPLARLERVALAAWYARQQQNRALAKGQGVVPLATASAADEIKRRMLKVFAHFFEDHPHYGAEVAAIRAGNGHLDLANDLQQLADLYEEPEVARLVESDPMHYRATDVADARARASEIFRALGYDDSEATRWSTRVQRAYTLLDQTYTRHCRAGALLFGDREDVALSYPPSLVSVVRAPRTRPEAGGATPGEQPLPTDPTKPDPT